jgi:hypothetical protein
MHGQTAVRSAKKERSNEAYRVFGGRLDGVMKVAVTP